MKTLSRLCAKSLLLSLTLACIFVSDACACSGNWFRGFTEFATLLVASLFCFVVTLALIGLHIKTPSHAKRSVLAWTLLLPAVAAMWASHSLNPFKLDVSGVSDDCSSMKITILINTVGWLIVEVVRLKKLPLRILSSVFAAALLGVNVYGYVDDYMAEKLRRMPKRIMAEIKDKNYTEARRFLESYPEVCSDKAVLQNYLKIACEKRGDREFIAFLQEKGARLTIEDAANLGKAKKVEEMLLSKPPTEQRFFLYVAESRAVANSDMLLLNALKKHFHLYYDQQDETPRLYSKIQVPSGQRMPKNPLYLAVGKLDGELVTFCFDHHNVNNRHECCLSRAAALEKGTRIIELLLDHGADPNILSDPYKKTPLQRAAVCGNLENCKLLLRRGAKPNMAVDKGNTALHYAVRHGREDICRVLLAAGADVYIRNDEGDRPINLLDEKHSPHYASKNVREEIRSLLKCREMMRSGSKK